MAPRRWLSPTESLVAQGFPVHPHFPRRAPGELLCSFNAARSDRTPRTVGSQSGNAMHVNVAGIVALDGYLNARYVDTVLMDIVAVNVRLAANEIRRRRHGLPVKRVTSKTAHPRSHGA
ncbi:unnamed protein product [Prorocentrum cordatum]|uniref:Uncharacterized protein n=1 Tax=Prorocentrum cordatum TaxID=2364126 RepID=A0ABN9SPZ1_9DINO|nr:unnamed protein product [Polarella glacialis]